MFDFLADLEIAFNFLKVLDTGVRAVQAAIPEAAGSTKLNVVLGTVEGAITAADTAEVSFTAVKPALTGAINAMVASYKTVGDPAFAGTGTPPGAASAESTTTTAAPAPLASPAPLAATVAQ